jgi:hypothetical protein
MEVNTGEVFLAHNKYMKPPKPKFHLCVSKNKYFLINKKPGDYTYLITPNDCSLLHYNSYLNLTTVRTEPIKDFKIIKKEELSKCCLEKIIEKLKIIPSILPIQKNEIIEALKACLL